ncbi:MAG TPA: HAD family hydrolase [Dokdonella sp.]
MRILAVSLDLDDTLWPVDPAIEQAERCLDAWLRRHHAAVAARWPIDALRALREQVASERPDLAHDFTAQRMLTLERAFAACDAGVEHVADAFEIYHAARNRVECYEDTRPALRTLSARLPLVSVSNGNADLERIGLRAHFAHCVSAREIGVAKPAPEIFHAACARLGVAPEHVLHVGDDPRLDVAGARAAGLRTAWLNRDARTWSAQAEALLPAGSRGFQPDLEIGSLGALADWIERNT